MDGLDPDVDALRLLVACRGKGIARARVAAAVIAC
jgi:hypothetical protein